jgi:hypothetical protein
MVFATEFESAPGKRLLAADRHPPLSPTVSISAFAVFRLTAMSSAISGAKRSVTGSPKRGPSVSIGKA